MPEIKALNGTVLVERNDEEEVELFVLTGTHGSKLRMTPDQAVHTYLAIQEQIESIVKGRMKRQMLLDLANRLKSV